MLLVHGPNMHTRCESLWPTSQLREFITATFAKSVVSRFRLLLAATDGNLSHARESGNQEEGRCLAHKERREAALHGIQLSASSRGSARRAGPASCLGGRGTDLAGTSASLAFSLAGATALDSIPLAIIIVRCGLCHSRGCVSFHVALHQIPVLSCSPRHVGT